MKIGVVSDTHVSRFEEIPEPIRAALSSVDLIIHAGDFTAKNVLDGLGKITEVKAVRGNMDSEILKGLLPEAVNFTIGNKKICVTHGWGAPEGIVDRVIEKCKNADVIVFGHSHEAYNRYHGNRLLFNPGKATNSYGLLEINQELNARTLEL